MNPEMRRYVIADQQTGEIVRVIGCLQSSAACQAQPGEVMIEHADATWGTHCVLNGALVAYTPQQAVAKGAPPGSGFVWSNATMAWNDTRTLAECKRERRQVLAQAWDEARAAGVTIGGKTAPTDPDSWTRYLAIKAMAAEGGWVDVPIPLIDGTFHLLTQAQAGPLWNSLKQMERTLLGRLHDRVQAVNAAATIAEVEAVVW